MTHIAQNCQTLSVVIPTFNCAEKLERCLRSVTWADEILVVDMYSTDETIKVVKRYVNARIYERLPRGGNFDENRKFGMGKTKGDWILKLDSDEELSKGLQGELRHFLARLDGREYDGFNFYNRVFMFGREVRHGFVRHGSHELRLMRKGKWHYDPYKYHEQVTVRGKVGYFQNPYYHYNHRTIGEFIDKANRYTELDAKILAGSISATPFTVAFTPFRTFVKLFFSQGGFLDGDLGFLVSFLYSFYNLVEKVKIYEDCYCPR